MKKYFLAGLIVIFYFITLNAQALEHKPKQLFISPVVSIGSPAMISQNNYGYKEMQYQMKTSGQVGVLLGWDYFLRASYRTGIVVSRWGQNYHDNFSGIEEKKKINNIYLHIPFEYKHVFGKKLGYDHEVISPYVYGSVMFGVLVFSDVKWFREQEAGSGVLTEESLIDFVTVNNINTDAIIEQGAPTNDRQLYLPIDLNLGGGAGFQYFITRQISLYADINMMVGIIDINASDWRFRDNKNSYVGSYNLYGGLRLGANIYL